MIELERIEPTALTSRDIEWLIRSAVKGADGVTVLDLVHAAQAGTAAIHRVKGDAEGVIVFEQTTRNNKVGIKIIGLAGKNLLRNMEEVHKAICVAARGCGAEFLWGMTTSKGLAMLYSRNTKAKKVAEVFIEDLT